MSPTYCHELLTNTISTWQDVGTLIAPPLSILAALLLVAGLCVKLSTGAIVRTVPHHSWAFLIAFSLIGLIPGIVAGYSQEPISGTFLTATVGIVSAMLSYAFAKSIVEDQKKLIPYLIIATLVGALTGYGAGGVSKERWLYYNQEVETRAYITQQVWGPAELQRRKENLDRLIKANPDGFITSNALNEANSPEPKAQNQSPDGTRPSCKSFLIGS